MLHTTCTTSPHIVDSAKKFLSFLVPEISHKGRIMFVERFGTLGDSLGHIGTHREREDLPKQRRPVLGVALDLAAVVFDGLDEFGLGHRHRGERLREIPVQNCGASWPQVFTEGDSGRPQGILGRLSRKWRSSTVTNTTERPLFHICERQPR